MNEKQRQTVDARIKKDKAKFLELLEKNPVIQVAVEHSGVSKATFFRWKDDKEFAKKAEAAIEEGNSRITDIAEAQMNSLIKEKHFGALKYRLDHPKGYKNQQKSDEEVRPLGMDLKIFKDKPITMHEMFPSNEIMQWPAVIRTAYSKIWLGAWTRIIIKAPRGGGKSKLLGTLGFDFWYLKNRSVVNMGGSAVQAQIVYRYFTGYCNMHPSVEAQVQGKPNASKTTSVAGNYFSSVTASTKQVRGPHPDI